MDRGAWWATVQGAAESQTQLSFDSVSCRNSQPAVTSNIRIGLGVLVCVLRGCRNDPKRLSLSLSTAPREPSMRTGVCSTQPLRKSVACPICPALHTSPRWSWWLEVCLQLFHLVSREQRAQKTLSQSPEAGGAVVTSTPVSPPRTWPQDKTQHRRRRKTQHNLVLSKNKKKERRDGFWQDNLLQKWLNNQITKRPL